MRIRGGVGEADEPTKQLIREEMSAVRRWLKQLEKAVDDSGD
jgi:hypothetical protein